MRNPLTIGQKEYRFKKDAITHYRNILNSYSFGQSLNDSDFYDLMDLIDYNYFNKIAETDTSEQEYENEITIEDQVSESNEELEMVILIVDIRIGKAQFNTKCFEIFYNDDTSQFISYLMMINNTKNTPEKLFNVACRNSINADIRAVKQEYFDQNSKKGQVKCQETGSLSKWEELVVDHRQPNTFSSIIDRFKEVFKIDMDKVEYFTNEENHLVFEDETLTEQFRNYHREKTNLRIVRSECNSSRTGLARIKRSSKDLIIK